MDRRCCVRNSLSVLSDSLIRCSDVLSFAILKWEVHCAMSYNVLAMAGVQGSDM